MTTTRKADLVSLVFHVLKIVIRLKQDLLYVVLSLPRLLQLSHQQLVLSLHLMVLIGEARDKSFNLVEALL